MPEDAESFLGVKPTSAPYLNAAGQGLAAYDRYCPWLDLNNITAEQREAFKKHTMRETFSVAGAIVLHFLTLGIFTCIFMGLKHSKLPRVRGDDFGAGQAIGFLFIPFFNFYWDFVFWLRLADRINFQFRLRNLHPPITRGLMLTAVIIGIIPYVGMISWMFLYPVVIAEIQSACNFLARESAQGQSAVSQGAEPLG